MRRGRPRPSELPGVMLLARETRGRLGWRRLVSRPARDSARSKRRVRCGPRGLRAVGGGAGLDPAVFSGHSLRAGFLTSAAAKGASIFKMMDVSRHKSVDTLRGYVRDAELFKDHAGAGLL